MATSTMSGGHEGQTGMTAGWAGGSGLWGMAALCLPTGVTRHR